MYRTLIQRRLGSRRFIDFKLIDSFTGNVIGKLTFKQLDERLNMARLFNLWIDENHRNLGIARNWLTLCMDYANLVLGIKSVYGKFAINNDAAFNLYQRLNFRIRSYNDQKYRFSFTINDKADERSRRFTEQFQRTLLWIGNQTAANSSHNFLPLYGAQFDTIQPRIDRRHEEGGQGITVDENAPTRWTHRGLEIGLPYSQPGFLFNEADRERLRQTNNNDFPMPQFTTTYTYRSDPAEVTSRPSRSKKSMFEAEPPPPPKPRVPDMFDGVPFYEKFKLPGSPHAMLSAMGVSELMKWLVSHRLDLNYTVINDLVGLESMIKNHEFSWDGEDYDAGGKFISRLTKVLSVTRRFKLTDDDKTEIGNLLNDYWVGGDSDFYFDLCNKIDWQSGVFGEKAAADGGSCWWTGSRVSRIRVFSNYMPEYCIGLRLFVQEGDNYRGVGRVWALRTLAGYPILFNSYGFNSPLIWAAKLSKYFGFANYDKVQLGVGDVQRQTDFPVNNHQGVIIGYPDDFKLRPVSFILGDSEREHYRF